MPKSPAPKIQDIRSAFFLKGPLRGRLLFHEGEQAFYEYQDGAWFIIPKPTFDSIIDDFVLEYFGEETSVNITSALLADVRASIKRERRDQFIYHWPTDNISTKVAFRDKTLDLASFEVLDHNPSNYAFHSLAFPLPTGPSDTFYFDDYLGSTFIDPETLEPDLPLIDFMISCLAFYLTPVNYRPFALIVQGPGGNGKSVLLDLLTAMIGERFTCSLSLEDLSSRFGAADLAGKRLNVVSEDPAKLSDTSRLKALISQDRVSFERKYEDRVTFRPRAKHIFSTNREIRFEAVDEATMRRVHIVPFHRLFRPKGDPRIDGELICEQDPSLIYNEDGVFRGHLIEEMPGILWRVLERLRELVDSRFNFVSPMAISEQKKEVQSSSSSALEFMHEHYRVDLKARRLVAVEDIYTEYLAWYEGAGRSDRFKLQPRAFWNVINKNMPEITTRRRIYRNGVDLRAKTHIVRLTTQIKGQQNLDKVFD